MSVIGELLDILDLEPLERNLFRGRSPQTGWKRVFGGQVIAQALMAANMTVEERQPHSLHGYFLLGGDPSLPIVYEVERIRDGKSFTTRRVVAIQRGEVIFICSASYQRFEEGFDHQARMPDVPRPADLPDLQALKTTVMPGLPEPVRKYFERERPIELRPVDLSRFLRREKPQVSVEPSHIHQSHVWIRATGRLPDTPAIHQCVLAYASDMMLLDMALVAHGRSVFEPDIMAASLDHALWFHRPFRADEWLLYCQDSPSASGARGFTRGLIFAEDGRLIASVCQEGMLRERLPG